MEVNFPLRSPTNSGLHLGVTLFERRTASAWWSESGARIFASRALRDSIATYLPSKSFGPKEDRRRESKTENGHIATVASRQSVFLQDI